MKRQLLITADGSTTIHLPEWNENYHSKHGAIQEAIHVFLKMGLSLFYDFKEVTILEAGFGTGLNAYLTLLDAQSKNLKVNYVGVEAYPVSLDEIKHCNFPEQLNKTRDFFEKLHTSEWEKEISINDIFILKKRKQFFSEITDENKYHLIYFDAFGPRVQPELWTVEQFQILFKSLLQKGVLVTYSAKGSVRRALQEVGFTVERLPGPPGKREMLRATKP
ncbi:MAG: tRNA (5-methylaminomethyl-2-thiouridine)(34)-methyltransferase MnmD [Flavobacteriaceae bacterium]